MSNKDRLLGVRVTESCPGYYDVMAQFVITVPISKVRLVHDVHSKEDLASIDGRSLCVPLSYVGWDSLEAAGADVPCNERRHRPFFGPKPFCVTHTGSYDGHGKFTDIHRETGETLCAFCYRPPHATPADPEGLVKSTRKKRGS